MNKYITQKGETWDMIAYKVYGDERKADIIMKANSQLLDTFVFDYGVEISVPSLKSDMVISDTRPPWR